MRSKAVAKNIVYATLLQFVTSVFGFITPILIIQIYGSELNGLTASINQILRYASLLEAGIAGAAIYELYGYMNKNDYNTISDIVSAANNYYKKIGWIFIICIMIFAPVYSFFIVNTDLNLYIVYGLFLILGLTGASEFFLMSRYRIIFTADQKGYIISIASIVSTVFYNMLVILLVNLKAPILLVYSVAISINFVRFLILNRYLKKIYGSNLKYNRKPKKKLLTKQKYVFIHEISYMVNSTVPIISINFLYNLNYVSIFAIYNIAITMINTVLSSVYSSVIPSYGNLVTEKNVEKENVIFSCFQFWYYMISTWLLATTALLINPFVSVYTRNIKTLDYSTPLLGYMLVIFAMTNCIRVSYNILIGTHGFYKGTSQFAIISSFIGLIISLTVGRISFPFVLVGPCVTFILSALYQKRFVLKNISNFTTGASKKRTITMISIIGSAISISQILDITFTSWAELFLYACIITLLVGVITGLLNILLNFKDWPVYINYMKAIIPFKLKRRHKL